MSPEPPIPESERYPWYQLLPPEDVTLLQGDFLDAVGVPVIPPDLEDMPSPEAGAVDMIASYRNVIVLSQSCDLDLKKLEFVLVAPYVSLPQAKMQHNILQGSKKREDLRQGNLIGLHPLNRCEIAGHETEYLVVNFRQVFTVPLTYALAKTAKPVARLRLLPPYREHLAQAYARFIMRVGLPVNIPKLP